VNAQNTSTESPSDLQLEIAHVLLIDVVDYSKLLVNDQIELLHELNHIVRETPCFRAAEASDKLIRVPTGDGMALLFYRSPEEPVRCALEISKALEGHRIIRLRMGVHSGPVNRVTDVNDKTNIVGSGINVAQRVLECGDAGHILLSKHVADDLEAYRQWQMALHDLGECEVKHGLRLHLFNLYNDGFGNPEIPQKLRRGRRQREAAINVRPVSAPQWPRVALIVALVVSASALLISSIVFFNRRATTGTTPFSISGAIKTLAAIPEKSIAVLPFENLSDEKENAYFADGVQDEILTGLSKVADLKVISRTSVLQYKTGAKRNLREIAAELGVAHVLEGSVQRAGDRVRVSAQLIDARSDSQLWAERYDRGVADVFAIQSELAGKIVAQLQAKISPSEKASIEKAPTNDIAAFNVYAHAKTLIDNALLRETSKNLFEAVGLLNEAVERDSSFFIAYYQLARAHDSIYQNGFDHTPARLALADAAIQSLRRLRPDAGETHLAVARHLYWGYLDYDRAREQLSAALDALPNSAEAFLLAAYIDRRQGRWEDSTQNFERASQLDPRDIFILQQLSLNYENLRRYADAAAVLDRALTIAPDDVFLRTQRAKTTLSSNADTKPLHTTVQAIVSENPNALAVIAGEWLPLAMYERDAEAAQRALAAMPPGGCYDAGIPFPNAWCEGLTAQMRGDKETARAGFLKARTELEKELRDQPGYAEAICALGVIDAVLGNKEKATREGERAVELMPVSKNAVEGALLIKYLAVIYAWVGDRDRAFEHLNQAVHLPSYLSYGQLRLHPIWEPLRGDPRFEQMANTLAPKP
jgi:TolB-like protein/class 3 adenylate cyclase/Tfp pilus assembly protein PilF